MPDKLASYRKKRNFKRTAEPSGAEVKGTGEYRYVMHKHAASHDHFDLRLEYDGVFRSWAVPKGPSLKPGEKKLAIEVEDHPLDYGDFEGVIPQKEYGGGGHKNAAGFITSGSAVSILIEGYTGDSV